MKRTFMIREVSSPTTVQRLVQLKTHPMVAQILANRNMTEDEMHMFLNGNLTMLRDPYQIVDMEIAAALTAQAVEDGTYICVYGDYDPDGVAGTALLYETLRDLGARVRYKLPDRHKEGYGMHPKVVEALKAEGVNFILTVDNGIRAHYPIEVAKRLGMTVVVVDHHEASDTLPAADAIVNINRHDDPYPFKGISGAGVAYKFVQVLYEKFGWPMEEANKYLDLVAIAAIADVMPLVDETRIMVNEGLGMMGSMDYDRIGLLALKSVMGIDKNVRSTDVGFKLSPAINAAGRLFKADMALDVLLETDPDEAMVKAERLKGVNEERKRLTEEAVERAFSRIEGEMMDDPIIVLLDRLTPEGIVGLVAGRITEKYGKMSVVFSDAEDEDEYGNKTPIFKASCRAPQGYHILKALESCPEFFMINGKPKFGGHAGAAGCSIPADVNQLASLRESLKAHVYATYGADIQPPAIQVESLLLEHEVTFEFLEKLQSIEPYGHEHPEPLFYFPEFRAEVRPVQQSGAKSHKLETSHYQLMGKPEKIHVKIFGRKFDVIAWRMAQEYEALGFPERFSVVGTVEENNFNGQHTLTIIAKYLLPLGEGLTEEMLKNHEINRIIRTAALAPTA